MVGSITDALAAAIPASALQPPSGKSADDLKKKDASVSSDSAAKQNAEDQARTEEAIKNRDAAAKEKPAFPVLDQEPKPDPVDPSQGYVAAIGVLGAIGSMFTRSPVTESMNAAAAALNSAKQMDAENFKKKSDIWKIKNDNALKLFDYQNNTYKDIMASKNKSVDERISELRANAVAFKDQNMMNILEARNPAVIEDLLAKSSDALASAQKKSAEMEKFANQNYATMQAMAVAKEDLDAGSITKEQYAQRLQEAANASAKAVQATKVTLTPEAIDQKVEALKNGATYSSLGLSTRTSNNPDKAAVDDALAKKYPDFNIVEAQNKNAGDRANQVAQGRRQGTTAQGAGELDQLLEPTRTAIHKVDLSKYPDLNSLLASADYRNGKPDVVEAADMIQEAQNAYTALLVRGGQRSDAAQSASEHVINLMMSPGQADRALDVMAANSKRIMKGIENARNGNKETVVPPEAVTQLKSDPSQEMQDHFDEVFGRGAAKKALEK